MLRVRRRLPLLGAVAVLWTGAFLGPVPALLLLVRAGRLRPVTLPPLGRLHAVVLAVPLLPPPPLVRAIPAASLRAVLSVNMVVIAVSVISVTPVVSVVKLIPLASLVSEVSMVSIAPMIAIVSPVPVVSGVPLSPVPVVSAIPLSPVPVVSGIPFSPVPVVSGVPLSPSPVVPVVCSLVVAGTVGPAAAVAGWCGSVPVVATAGSGAGSGAAGRSVRRASLGGAVPHRAGERAAAAHWRLQTPTAQRVRRRRCRRHSGGLRTQNTALTTEWYYTDRILHYALFHRHDTVLSGIAPTGYCTARYYIDRILY